MPWFRAAEELAVELAPSDWTAVAAERVRESGPRCKAAGSFDAADPALPDTLRQFRVTQRLPFDATLVLWPSPADPGVATLDERPRVAVMLPKARVIRERIAPFVRAGGRATDVLLPHEAAGRLAAFAGWTRARVLLLEPAWACLAVVEGRDVAGSHLTWSPSEAAANDQTRLLARYQFAARLMPHLRGWAAAGAHATLVVCGRHQDLRATMVPIVEALDREIDVLDADLVGGGTSDAGDPGAVASRQLAWAVAAGALR